MFQPYKIRPGVVSESYIDLLVCELVAVLNGKGSIHTKHCKFMGSKYYFSRICSAFLVKHCLTLGEREFSGTPFPKQSFMLLPVC